MRPTSIDAITDGRLTKRTARSGSVTLQALSRIVPNSFLDIDGDTASLNAAVVLTPQTTLDISGVKTLKLGGGDSPTEAAFLYTGSGRILVDGVTVTSADKDGQPLAMSAQGRPYIVVSSRGRFEATDATLSDLGVQPTGTDKGDPGISFNTDSTGALVRTQLLRNTTGAELSKSKNIKLEGVTATESWSDGLLLQGDVGTTLTDIKAERNGGNGVTVTGESSAREIHDITTNGNHSYGVAVVGQTKAQVNDIQATGDGAGGLRVNRCTDCVVRDVTTADQPIGLFMHVNTTNVDAAEPADDRRAARDRGGEDHQGRDDHATRRSTAPGWPASPSAVTTSRSTACSVSDARTGVRIERGAGNVVADRAEAQRRAGRPGGHGRHHRPDHQGPDGGRGRERRGPQLLARRADHRRPHQRWPHRHRRRGGDHDHRHRGEPVERGHPRPYQRAGDGGQCGAWTP